MSCSIAVKTWALTKVGLQGLQQNDRAMIIQVCGVKPDEVSQEQSQDLLVRLLDLDTVLREKRLRCGHVMRSDGALKMTYDLRVTERRGRGRPQMSWPQHLKNDCSSWGLSQSDPKDRKICRRDVKFAKLAVSQSSGKRSPEMVVPFFLQVNQKEPAVGR